MLVSLITPWPALIWLRDTHYYTVPVYGYKGHNYIRIFDFRFYQTVLAGKVSQHQLHLGAPSEVHFTLVTKTVYDGRRVEKSDKRKKLPSNT